MKAVIINQINQMISNTCLVLSLIVKLFFKRQSATVNILWLYLCTQGWGFSVLKLTRDSDSELYGQKIDSCLIIDTDSLKLFDKGLDSYLVFCYYISLWNKLNKWSRLSVKNIYTLTKLGSISSDCIDMFLLLSMWLRYV